MPTCETLRNRRERMAPSGAGSSGAGRVFEGVMTMMIRAMKSPARRIANGLAAGSLAAACAAWAPLASAVSLEATGPAQPLPDLAATTVSLPIAENFTAGSAALVPLVASDLPAGPSSLLDASQPTGGGDL